MCSSDLFQLESPGMRQLIQMLEPDRFEDLMALVALYRPGLLSLDQHVEYAARKHGRRQVTYPHPALEEVLRDTYGIIVYQEQVMQVAVRLAGYTMGQADTLRKVMGKKVRKDLIPHRKTFIEGAVGNGIDAKRAEEIFELIVPFADYGFNASHACAYAYIAYQTAYLKAHHPVEYMAAMLTSVKDDKDRKPYYLNACRQMDIEVLPPDVNGSELDFAPVGDGSRRIRYGLSAVRNVGSGVVLGILEARRTKGAFESFADFCRKVDPLALQKRVLESLIYAGAFDSLGYARRALLENQEKVSGPIVAERRSEAAGQFSLFGGDDGVVAVDDSSLAGEEFERSMLLRLEKDVLGSYVTDHPLLAIQAALAALTTCPVPDAVDLGDGDQAVLAGIVSGIQRKFTREGEPYVIFRLEDLTGGIAVIAFPEMFRRAGALIDDDAVLLVTGRIDHRGRETQIRAADIRVPDVAGIPKGPPPALVVHLRPSDCTPAAIGRLKEVLAANPGSSPVRVRFAAETGEVPLEVGAFSVDAAAGLLAEIQGLFGPGRARLEPVGPPS